MDTNTISNNRCLSEGDRKVTGSPPAHPYPDPDHPERFDHFENVLCKEGLYGRSYWEADCSGNKWAVTVSYKGIMRKENMDKCRFGYNAKSWRLSRYNQVYNFIHNQIVCRLRQFKSTVGSATIGVYLNHSAGILSFYSVSGQMTLLHKVQTTFTEPLYAGFVVGAGSVVRILEKS